MKSLRGVIETYAVLALVLIAPACTREGPPEIPEVTLAAKPAVPAPVIEDQEDSSSGPVEPPPPRMTVRTEAPPKPAEAPPPKPSEGPAVAKPAAAEPSKPSIVGTWRVVQAIEGDRPMPPGMDMRFTFAQDGTLTMAMTMVRPDSPEPMSQSQNGTYSLSDDQITISIDRETKSGTLKFESNDRASINVDNVKLVMERQ